MEELPSPQRGNGFTKTPLDSPAQPLRSRRCSVPSLGKVQNSSRRISDRGKCGKSSLILRRSILANGLGFDKRPGFAGDMLFSICEFLWESGGFRGELCTAGLRYPPCPTPCAPALHSRSTGSPQPRQSPAGASRRAIQTVWPSPLQLSRRNCRRMRSMRVGSSPSVASSSATFWQACPTVVWSRPP